MHDDLFFHLRTGDSILRTGAVPHADSFSHTLPGAAWTTHEWGFAVLVDAVYRAVGYPGLVWLTSALTCLMFGMVYLLMRRLAAPAAYLCVPLLLVAMIGDIAPGFFLRAALLSSLALSALQLLLHMHYARPRWTVNVAIVALFFVWSNVHVGVVFGFVVMLAYWFQGTLDAWRASPTRGFGSLVRSAVNARAGLALACSLVTLANANGVKLWTFPFELNALYYHSGIEWSLNMFEPPLPRTQPFFYLGLAITMAACLPWRRFTALLSGSSSPLIFQALCTGIFACLALRSTRFIPEFFTFALPLCAARWSASIPTVLTRRSRGAEGRGSIGRTSSEVDAPVVSESDGSATGPAAVLRWSSAAIALVALVAVHPTPPRDPIPDFFPKRAATFMERERVHGRMYNFVNWGGYLGWRLNAPVFWDGRNEVFGPINLELAREPNVGKLVEHYRLDLLVLNQDDYERWKPYLAAQRDAWALVYFDDQAALYVKTRGPFSPELLARAYRLLQPFAVPSSDALRSLARDPALVSKLNAEITRQSDQSGGGQLASYLRGALQYARGNVAAATRK